MVYHWMVVLSALVMTMVSFHLAFAVATQFPCGFYVALMVPANDRLFQLMVVTWMSSVVLLALASGFPHYALVDMLVYQIVNSVEA